MIKVKTAAKYVLYSTAVRGCFPMDLSVYRLSSLNITIEKASKPSKSKIFQIIFMFTSAAIVCVTSHLPLVDLILIQIIHSMSHLHPV